MRTYYKWAMIFGFALLAGCGGGSATNSTRSYRIDDLGFPAGAGITTVSLRDVNTAGDLVGTTSGGSSGNAFSSPPRPVLFHAGTWVALGPVGQTGRAIGISAAGTITGDTLLGASTHLVIWQPGTVTDLNVTGSIGGVNANGDIAGNTTPPSGNSSPFLYAGGQITFLPTPNGSFYSDTVAINNAGQIAGTAYFVATGTNPDPALDILHQHAVLWQQNKVTDLGTFGGSMSRATNINTSGTVIGEWLQQPNAMPQGFIYSLGRMTPLPSLPNTTASHPLAINSSGLVVGKVDSTDGNPHPVLWQYRQAVDLNSVLPAGSGWTLLTADLIDESNRIYGQATYNGAPRMYRLTPQ